MCRGDFWFDKKGFRVDYYLRPFACLKAEVAALFGVPAIRVGEGFTLPLRRLNSLADRVNKDIDVFEARQVDIPGEVFGQFFDADVVSPP